MNEKQTNKLDELTLDINFNLAILKSAIKNDDADLEICVLESFVENIYQTSQKIRNLFENEL